MSNRKQYIIDKHFQLKHTFSVIGIVSVITALIVGAIAVSVVYNNEKIDNIHYIESNNFDFLTSPDLNTKAPSYRQAIQTIISNHNRNMETLTNVIMYNKILLIALVIIIISEGLLLYVILIRKTHKISGPIYVMTNYLNQLLNGQYPVVRPLRNKDELQDFYNLFLKFIDEIKKKDTKTKGKNSDTR